MDEEVAQKLADLDARLRVIEKMAGIGVAPPATPPAPEPSGPPPDRAAAPPVMAPPRDVESLIGAHWLNRIGIAAVLVGVAYFLKYAFENEWIGPAARVGIGIAIGAAILAWSERFHARGYFLFSHTLKVVSVGVLYLSIWAASQTYSLIGDGTAFAAMAVVTIVLAALAVRHKSEFIAGLAMTSGFLTPVLLSTGTNREVSLFAYVALLDVAALALVVFFPWVRALLVSFIGTQMLFIGWYSAYYSTSQQARTIAFATLFMIIFALVPVLRRWSERLADQVIIMLPFLNALAYFIALSWMLSRDLHRLAYYATALAGFFLAIAVIPVIPSPAPSLIPSPEEGEGPGRGQDGTPLPDPSLRLGMTPISAAHIAIALGFITIAIPLRFDEFSITIGWMAEAAALLVLAMQPLSAPARRAFRILGSIALGLALFRLLLIDRFHPAHIFWNMRALLYAMAVAIFAGISLAASRSRNAHLWRFATTMAHALALIGLTAEVRDAFRGASIVRNFAMSALWMAYGAVLMVAGFRLRQSFLRWLALALLGITTVKVFLVDLSQLERIYRVASFLALGVLLLAISFAYQRKWLTVPPDDAGA